MTKLQRRLLIAGGLIMGWAAGSAWAEDVWVQKPSVDVREGKGAVYPLVQTVKKGDKLTILQREGKWLKVQLQDKQGYIHENAIATQQVAADTNVFRAMGSRPDASVTQDAAAGKGLSQKAEDWAKDRGLNQTSIDKMDALIANRRNIDPKEFEQFCREGNVGADR